MNIYDIDSQDPHLDISWVGGVAARRPRTYDINVCGCIYADYVFVHYIYTYILKTW